VENTPITPETLPEDQQEYSLRPKVLAEFIGQLDLKENLRVFIDSAKKRGETLDHILFSGPPGLGKTTLAHIISREMGTSCRSTAGPIIEKQGDLAAILTNLEPNQVLFIDEIHRMSRVIEEVLYSAMEDFTLDIIIGEGPSARTVKLDLPRFTLIGATTRAGLLSSPLRDRFGIPLRLEYYRPEDLKEIIVRSAAILNTDILDEAALEIGRRSRGTPRIANRLLKRARDFADLKTNGVITVEIVDETLQRLGIDELGLDKLDRNILETILKTYGGGPVGIAALAASVSEEKDTLEDVCEPFLLQTGMIQRTPRGRMLTDKGKLHILKSLGETPEADQQSFL
jgi:Holliday junction DNA helicase RuvB